MKTKTLEYCPGSNEEICIYHEELQLKIGSFEKISRLTICRFCGKAIKVNNNLHVNSHGRYLKISTNQRRI